MVSIKKPSVSFFLLLAIILDFNYLQGQSIPSYVPTNGLVGWWPFNGNAQDASGNGNHGNVSGPTLTADRFGVPNRAYNFAANGGISCMPFLGMNEITISFWFFIPTSSDGRCMITQNTATNCSDVSALIIYHPWIEEFYASSSTGTCGIGSATGTGFINANSSLYGTWHLRTMIQKNNGVVLDFIDTTLMTSHNRSNFYWCNSNNASFRIGGPWWGGDPQFFTGKLDDIGVWNRALTNPEILELYLSQQCQISITSQPLNQVTSINSTADFAINSSISTATHHWQSNSGFGFQDLYNAGQYSGVTSSTLTVSNTSLQNNNQLFRCIVTTPNCGSDTSDIVTLTVSSSGQGPALPRKFNYQAVVRDSMGALITNRHVSLRVTLLRGSAPHSPELFKEAHQASTNASGLLTVKIGNGQSILGSMDSIDWSQGMVYLRTEIDPTGGNTFSMVNTAELLSVPYALYSLNSGGGPSGPAGPQGPSGPMGLQGVQGAPGNDGVGILSITNTGNNMVITLSNGNTYSVPLPAPNDQAAKNAKTLIYTTDGF
jgi:hypothetical protein